MAAPMRKKIFSFHKLLKFASKSIEKRCFGNVNVSVKELLSTELCTDKLPVSAKGWLRKVRKQKQWVFCSLSDGSCTGHIQVVADANSCQSDLSTGCSVHIKGDLVKSPGRGQAVEIQAQNIEVVGPCDNEEYPLKPKSTYTLDYVRTLPHLRVRTQHHQRLMEIRNTASMAVHRFFQENGFVFVHTPILTSNDCEGAGELFQVKTSKDDIPLPQPDENISENSEKGSNHFFGHPAFLTVSGQLHLEAITGAFGKAYNFGPTFRAENSPGRHHLAEFYMIEGEIAFTENIECILKVMEGLVQSTTRDILHQNEEAVQFLWKQSSIKHISNIANNLVNKSFLRMTYTEAINILEKKKFNAKWGCDMSKEYEKYLVQYCDNCPVFVTDFPASIKPFYARQNMDSDTVSAVDLLVPEVGELCGGSLREERYDILKSRLDLLTLTQQYQWYMDLRRYGSVPHGGFGLGFERYLQCLLGISNIKDTIPFPRWVHHCSL